MSHFVHISQLKGNARQIAEEGFADGFASETGKYVNPYGAARDGLAFELYAEGFQKGSNKRYNERQQAETAERIRKMNLAAVERRGALERKLSELLGEDLVEELFDYVKELIQSETSRHADY